MGRKGIWLVKGIQPKEEGLMLEIEGIKAAFILSNQGQSRSIWIVVIG